MNTVNVVGHRKIVLEAVPAELVAAWTCHVRTTCSLLYRDLAAGALVCNQKKVKRTHH